MAEFEKKHQREIIVLTNAMQMNMEDAMPKISEPQKAW